MAIPYQASNCKRIIAYSMLILLCFVAAANVQAYDSLFVVEDVTVDITAENSVAAQEQAFEKAQIDAFQILTQRMVEDAQAASVATPDPSVIASFVKDYEVTNEQFSAVRYVGTYTIRFHPAAVSRFFSVSGVNYTEATSKTLLILPVLQKDGQNLLWSEGNDWMQAWGRAALSDGLVPVEVPIGDLMDITDMDEMQPLNYKQENLNRMLARYNAGEAAIMIAVPGQDLQISIYRTDRSRAEHVQDIAIEWPEGATRDQIYDHAVLKAHAMLQRDWKRKTISSAAQEQIFHARVPFSTIRQWVKVQQILKNMPGLRDLSVLSMKKTEANVSFTFRGDEARLRESLARTRLSLGQGHQNPNGVMYDLIYADRGGEQTPPGFYRGHKPSSAVALPSAGDKQDKVLTF